MAWIGPVVGGILGAVGNSGSSSQTTQNSVPPEFSGLASQVGQYGQGFANLPYQPYPYAQVADFNPYQYAGFDMAANQAFNNQLPQQAQDNLSKTLSGGFMGSQGTNPYAGSNPFLEQNIQNTLGDMTKQFNMNVAPSMTTNALKSGSFGNSGLMEREDATRSQFAQDLGRTSGNMRMQDYTTQQGLAENQLNRTQGAFDAERNRQMGALGQAGNIYNLQYAPSQQLGAIGSTMQQQGQNQLNAQYGQFQEAQNYPFKIWDAMRAPFGGVNAGGTSTTTGPSGNPVAGLMGGAMLGSKVGGVFNAGNTAFGGQGYTGAGTPNDMWSGMGYY